MDPCHSAVTVPRSPATSAVTVAHLISNIEQLKNKDKLISQLEKDLGQSWAAATHLAALERDGVQTGRPSPPSPGALPGGSTMEPPDDDVSWTPPPALSSGAEEVERSTGDEGFAMGKTDLPMKLKDCKERNKMLTEKCRTFLQRNKELTAQTRAYKDSNHNTLHEHRKMQELLEHSKLRILQLSRQLSEVKAEKTNVEQQTGQLEQLRKEMAEDKKMIGALRQACSEKDRRIELIQHRKKRRRIIGSAEKQLGIGLRETFYGYEDLDTTSQDSEHSMSSSMSHSTLSISDEDLWDDVLSREETERNYHRLMMEQLELQKSHAMLQSQMGNMQDPQREALTRSEMQHDLFKAQCRIEHLEKLINEIGEGEVMSLLKERESMASNQKSQNEQLTYLESECRRLRKELTAATEREEDLEFRLMEFENGDEDDEDSSCEAPSLVTANLVASSASDLSQATDPSEIPLPKEDDEEDQQEDLPAVPSEDQPNMDQLHKEASALLKGKGRDAEAVLKKLSKMRDVEQRAHSLEAMAHELQMKVISLQKERDGLQDELSHRGASGKGDTAAAAASRERQENLQLKAELDGLSRAHSRVCEERTLLQEQVEDWKAQYEFLKQQLDQLTCPVGGRSSGHSSGDSAPPSPSTGQSSRRSSKDRKSKIRGEEDPVPQTKRRKSEKPILKSNSSSNMLRNSSSIGDIRSAHEVHQGLSRTYRSNENIEIRRDTMDEPKHLLVLKVNRLEAELMDVQNRNFQLQDQIKQATLEKNIELEADQQMLLDKMRAMDNEVCLLRQENIALGHQLRQRVEDFQDSQGELSPRLSELEDYCEDLQERLHGAELRERQLKEKLRLLEASIEDAEMNEMSAREDNQKLLSREEAARTHIVELQRTVKELKEIILDKDIVEHALRDKVDFLQKAEAASVERIEELEAVEKELREQLEQQQKDGTGSSQSQRDSNKIQELRHQITFLETDGRAQAARIAELEENEETLRENWRRVADEDFNRTQCLEEKVKLLESMNRDLKSKLSDAQEYYIINATPSGNTSLAAELAISQSSLRSANNSLSDLTETKGDGVDGNPEEIIKKKEEEQKVLKEKIRKLERKFSDVSEMKNSKIETLQEKIVLLKENEIKLSETIMEMEMTEREIRAKLALYESSEVTVEKMLKYQSKIEELRTSQESLLDQLESMENQEMTLQEKMQEMERTLRGKIVTLEVEMKSLKQKELKATSRIRDMEKQEKELTEKVAQQAEKENGLYVKISSLKEELKSLKEENEALKIQIAEKEDKVRKSKLLEVKLLEIEMEFGKKTSALSSKLRHREEELRQKEVTHKQEMIALKDELNQKSSEQSQRTSILERMFAQKEKDLVAQVSALEVSVRELTCERDEYEAQIKDITETNRCLKDQNVETEIELERLRGEMKSANVSKDQGDQEMAMLRDNLEKEQKRAENAESKLKQVEEELTKERQTVSEIEKKMVALKENIAEKMKSIESSFAEKENEMEKERRSHENEMKLKSERVEELKKELGESNERVSELESQCEHLKQKSSHHSILLAEKSTLETTVVNKEEERQAMERELKVCKEEFNVELSKVKELKDKHESNLKKAEKTVEEKNREIEKLKDDYESQLSALKTEQNALEKDLQSKVHSLSIQLSEEVAQKEQHQSNSQEQQKSLAVELSEVKAQLEQRRLELIQKLSELEARNKENCELSLEVSQLKHSLKTLENEHSGLNAQVSDLRTQIENNRAEREELIQQLDSQKKENSEIDSQLKDTRATLLQKQFEMEKVIEEKSHQEVMVQEQMVKTEAMVQESKQQKDSKEAELLNLRQDLAEKEGLIEQQDKQLITLKTLQEQTLTRLASMETKMLQLESELEDKSDKENLLEEEVLNHKNLCNQREVERDRLQKELEQLQEESSEIIVQLEAKISKIELDLEVKETELFAKESQIKSSAEEKKVKNDEIATLHKQLEEKQQKILETEQEYKDSHSQIQSQVSTKQQELEHYQTELQKCLKDIDKYKTYSEVKESELIKADQKYQTAVLEHKELTQKLEERDHKCDTMESAMTSMELCLVEAENRYRELEAKCSSLELQLEEHFAQAQETQKLVLHKDEQQKGLQDKVASLEGQLSAGQAQLALKSQECTQLQSRLATAAEEMTQTRTEYSSLQANLEVYAAKKKDSEVKEASIRTEVEQLQQKYSEASMAIKSTEDRWLESKGECEALEKKLSGVEVLLQEKDNQCLTLKSNIADLEKQKKDSQKRIEAAVVDVRTCEVKCEEMDKKIKTLESSLKEKNALCDKAKSDFDDLTTKYNEKCVQYTDLKQTLKGAYEASHSQEQSIDRLKSRLVVSENELQERMTKMEELSAKIVVFENALLQKETACKDSQSGLQELEKRNMQLQIECESVKAGHSNLQAMHEQKSIDLQDAMNKMKEHVQAIKNLEDDLQKLHEELSETKQKQSDVERALERKHLEQQETAVSLNQNYSELSETKKELGSLRTDLKELKSKYNTLEKEHSEKVALCTELKSKLLSSENNVKAKSEDIAGNHNEIERMKTEIRERENHCSLAVSALEDVRGAMSVLEGQYQSAQKERDTLEKRNQDLKKEFVKVQERLQEFETSLQSSSEQCKVLTSRNVELEEKLEEVTYDFNQCQEQLKESEANVAKAGEDVKHVEQVNDELEAENRSLQSELEDAAKEFENIRDGFEETKKNIENKLTSMAASKQTLEEEFSDIQSKCDEQSKQLQDLMARLSDKENELEALVQKQSELDSMRSERDNLHQKLSEKEEQEKDVKKSLEQDKFQQQSVVKDLETENSQLNDRLSELENLYSDAHFENIGLMDEMSHVKAERTILETQVTELQKQLRIEKASLLALESRLQALCSGQDQLLMKSFDQESSREDSDFTRPSSDDVVSESEISISVASSSMCSTPTPGSDSVDANDNEISRHSEQKIQKLCDVLEVNSKELSSKNKELKALRSELNALKEKEGKTSKRLSELECKEKNLLEQMADIEQTVIIPLENENQELKDELSLVKEERDEALATAINLGEEDNNDSVQKSLDDALHQRDELERRVKDLNQELETGELDKTLLVRRISELEETKSENEEKIKELEEEVQRLLPLEQETTIVEEAENCLMDKVLELEDREQQLLSELDELKKSGEPTHGGANTQDSESLMERLNYLEQKNEVLQDAEGKYVEKIMELEEIQQSLRSQIDGANSSQNQQVLEVKENVVEIITPSNTASLSQAPTIIHTIHKPVVDSVDISVDTTDLPFVSEPQPDHSKDEKIQYLENKLQLLQDSEAKLMESLLEMREGIEEKASQKSPKETELEKKVDTLQEENEFLAESVENYKQLYKEEKEKTNELQPALQELQETQLMVEDIQSEYEEQLAQRDDQMAQTQASLQEKDQHIAQVQSKLNEKENRLAQIQVRLAEKDSQISQLQSDVDHSRKEHFRQVETLTSEHSEILSHTSQQMEELEGKIDLLQKQLEQNPNDHQVSELQEKIRFLELQNSQMHSYSEVSDLQDKIQSLQHHNERLRTEMSDQAGKLRSVQTQNDQLQQTVESLKLVEEDLHTQDKLKVQELQGRVDAMTQRRDELRTQHRQRELRLQGEIDALGHKEAGLVRQVEELQGELRELRVRLDRQEEEISQQSDSGVSFDDPRSRPDSLTESQPSREVYRSKATLQLTRPSSAPVTQAKRASPLSHGSITPPPVAPPTVSLSLAAPPPVAPPRAHRRGGKSRTSSTASSSQEELNLIIVGKESSLKQRIQQFETASGAPKQSTDSLYEHVDRRRRHTDNRSATRSPFQRPVSRGEEDQEEEGEEFNRSFSSVQSASSSTMLDKPEDVLLQRIKELEGLDKYNKTQLSELERDREVLHEIARKDKATIHDLNVKIRELQLSERSLKEQVTSLEVSENSLFTKCDELEAQKSKLEDRVHELEIHERRLRELVRRLKLDEEKWLSKSGGMETAVAELSANEQTLKRTLKDIEMEKGGLSERAQYLEARIRELENVEATLLQRVKTYETNEVSLQNRLVQLGNAEAASHSKASELDVMNMDLSQRLQKAVEENAVLSQHITQLHGQVQEIDRRLMSSQDSELAYKQHVESLQKNESSLQKKVREYELREIDSQARIRELEQTDEISKDKLAALQRSENRLKYRVQELEGIGAQIPGELTPGQRQAVPTKLEDCQKRVVVLQAQVENLQLQLRQALNTTTQDQLASQADDDDNTVNISRGDFAHLQTRSSMLEETEYQMEEVEHLNEQLNETILQLRQGKGACGHEVEIEVLKKRLASYKTFISQLKSSLSIGQATSLLGPEPGSGPKGDELPPAHYLPGLASERVLQSIRGLPQGKADNSANTGLKLYNSDPSQVTAQSPVEEDPASTREEESHWRAIEARKPQPGSSSRGGAPSAAATPGSPEVTPAFGPRGGNTARLGPYYNEIEEVTIGVDLPSESDLSSHYRYPSQNDTDNSSSSPVRPPRRGRAKAGSKTYETSSSENELSEPRPTKTSGPAPSSAAGTTAANEEHFDKQKSLPSQALPPTTTTTTPQEQPMQLTKRVPLSRFANDSFYLPSSTQEGADSLDDDEDAPPPPLPSSLPPGMEVGGEEEEEEEEMQGESSPRLSELSSADGHHLRRKPGSGRKDSLADSTNGMSIRDRIAMIEKQLQSDAGSKTNDDQIYFWKKQSTEALKQADHFSRENKYLNEEINRLEKELEEKRRYIHVLELWLTNLEDLLKNQGKQTDREMVEQLQLELGKLRSDLRQTGYRQEDAVMDPAALKTELEHRDKEISTKRTELELLAQELARSREECRNVESMRRTALDSLRHLEQEVIVLQDKDQQLQMRQEELQALKTQYDEMERFKNQAVNALQPLQSTVDKLAHKCQEKDVLLRRLASELRRSSYLRPSTVLDDLTRLEQALALEAYNGTNDPNMTTGPGQSDRIRDGIRSSSLDDLDLPFSDTDSVLSGPTTGLTHKRKRPTPYVNSQRPRSAETLGGSSNARGGLPGTHAHSGSLATAWNAGGPIPSGASRGQFVAIADYDPGLFSQSGRPHQELVLRERDQVIVTGPMDHTGYYEAVVNGQSGLVPANYLQPLHVNGHSQSPTAATELHPAFRDEMMAPPAYHHLSQQAPPMSQGPSQQHPDPPHHVHIKGIVSENSILLAWSPPYTDNNGVNKGFKVLGYMVYLDNKEYEQVPSSSPCEVVVEGLNRDRRHHLAVQCLCGGGFASPRAELVLEGMVTVVSGQPKDSGGQGRRRRQSNEDALDTDLSSVLNSLQYKKGRRKSVIALYEYNPEDQSPHDYTSLELGFGAGEVIHVYGDPRKDGFYLGEIDGKRGLVPACFVEELSKVKK